MTITTLELAELVDLLRNGRDSVAALDPEIPCDRCEGIATFFLKAYCLCDRLYCGACVTAIIESYARHIPRNFRCTEDGKVKFIEKMSDFIVSLHPL